MNRRFFLFAAPAIVAAPSLMRVSTLLCPPPRFYVGAALEFTSADLTMAVERFTETYLRPQIRAMTQIIEDAVLREYANG